MVKSALLIVDVQNDFCEGGSLAVEGSNEVVDVINALRERVAFPLVVLTKDHHPPNHVSFFSTHSTNVEAKLFDELTLKDGKKQRLWPDHCVQGSRGACLHPDLNVLESDHVVHKGTSVNVDSYSGFFNNNNEANQGQLHQYLQANSITDVVVVGLAYDYCVGNTALDACKLGYRVHIPEDATRSVAPASTLEMVARLKAAGVHICSTTDVNDDATIRGRV